MPREIKCDACGDEGGPHGLIGRLLLCEHCIAVSEAVATAPLADAYGWVILQAAATLKMRKANQSTRWRLSKRR